LSTHSIRIISDNLAGKAGQTNANDAPELTSFVDSFKSILKEQAEVISNAIKDAIKDTIGKSGSVNSNDDINSTIKGVLQELGSEVIKMATNGRPKTIIDDIPSNKTPYDHSIDKLSSKASDKLSEKGINIDSTAISDAIKKIIPQSAFTAIKSTTDATSSIKDLFRDINRIVSSIESMRQSGGKIDSSEIGVVTSGLLKISEDVKSLMSHANTAKDSFKNIPSESKDSIKNFTEAINNIQNKIESTVKETKEKAKDDPQTFVKEIISAVTSAITKSDSLKGTNIGNAAENLVKQSDDINKLTSGLESLREALKQGISGGGSKIEGVENILKNFDNVVKNIGSIPKEGKSDIYSSPSSIKASEEFTQQVNLIAKSSTLQKSLPDNLEVPVTLVPDLKKLHDDILTGQDKPIKLPVDIDSDAANKQLADIYKNISSIKGKSTKGYDSNEVLIRNREALAKNKPTAYQSYQEQIIYPEAGGKVTSLDPVSSLSKEAGKIKTATEDNIKRLSSSLHTLQTQIVTTLDKEFEASQKKWGVVKPSNSTDPAQAFSLTPGNKQWSMQVANMERLQKISGDYTSSPANLVSNYKAKAIDYRATAAGSSEKQSELVGQWLKTVSIGEIEKSSVDQVSKDRLIRIQKKHEGVEVSQEMKKDILLTFGGDKGVSDIFKKTYADAEANRELQREGLVKNIAIPAANVSTTGDASFTTTHGSSRSLPKFATFETGFEALYKQLEDSNSPNKAKDFIDRIKKAGIRPNAGNRREIEELSEDMIGSVAKTKVTTEDGIPNTTGARGYIKDLYTNAAVNKSAELEKSGGPKAEDFMKSINDVFDNSDGVKFPELIESLRKLDLTAYDAARSLNNVKSKNVYDIMGDVLEGNKKISPLKTLGSQTGLERSTRDFESAIGEVVGLTPLLEGNRPRRGYHQENIVNLLTRTSPLYGNVDDRKSPMEQKSIIKDLNLELQETLNNAQPGKAPTGIKRLSSLGIPESQAGNVEEYRPGNLGGTKYLNALNATSIKMSSEDLTALAPFQQFQQAGRNISNVTNAMANSSSNIQTPNLRSEGERALIESGRYGDKGYGYNVTAEMRNTSANFEDQIIISGKLAKAMTSAVSTLVKPSAAGRVRGGSAEERITGASVTPIEENITGVANKFMDILGRPESYKGRADEALIKEVSKTVAVVRGERIEVQEAKLAETFMNYFGRKLTTRYGSKGVSVTPTDQPDNLGKILQQFSGKPITVDPDAKLGYQVAPKSMGQMATEIFGKNISDDLRNDLKKSGNKFMIDIFHNPDMVSSDEADKNKKLYADFSSAWTSTKGVNQLPLPEIGIEGIKQMKENYSQRYGEKSAYELKPIDVRISSYGAAKRGLQTEFMESIFSNLANVGTVKTEKGEESGVTTLKQFKKDDYEELLKKGGLAKYSEALGYEGATKEDSKGRRTRKTEEDIAPELFKMFGGKGEYGDQLKANDSKAILAQRAASLEAQSSYYSTVVDEFGKKRKGLVGEKFLQIIEEPTENPAWSGSQIEHGQKGARLNLPAYSAYSTVFGEKSDMMKEVNSSLNVDSRKHWEYLKALQTVQNDDADINTNLNQGLTSVDVRSMKPFDLATGVHGKKEITDESGNTMPNPRSFADSVLDTEKYPEAFKLSMPTGKYLEGGKVEQKPMYIPGAAARSTYPEPLIAGEHGMDQVTRRLSHVVNMAKELQDVMDNPEQAIEPKNVKKKVASITGGWLSRATELSKDNSDDNNIALQHIIEKMMPSLSKKLAPSTSLIDTGGMSEYDFANKTLADQLEKASLKKVNTKGKVITESMARATTVGTINDMLVGKKTGSPEQLGAPTALSRAMDEGKGFSFASGLGVNVVQDTIDKRVESLQKAKIDYYSTLADTAIGKGGSINELLFNRKIPAVMGKAVVAVTDKSADIEKFKSHLQSIDKDYGIGLSDQFSALDKVAETHGEAIKGYKKIGIPVLKQEEIGIPESFAAKIPTDFTKKYTIDKDKKAEAMKKPEDVKGTLADLLKYKQDLSTSAFKEQDLTKKNEMLDYIKEELPSNVESIRFPFTGSSSISPFRPKLMEEGAFLDKDKRALEKNSLIVPGVPEGLEGLAPIISSLQEKMNSAMSERERLQTTGGDGSAEEIVRLTAIIRELNSAISNVIPKYVAQAQKLDFDGDQIEIHSARTTGARQDIDKHFERFHESNAGKDITTQDIFMKRFLSEAADTKTTGDYVFGEGSAAFEKKFPAGKGFDFMQSPFLNEEMDYLTPRQSLGVLSGRPGVGDVSNIIKDTLSDINTPEDKISEIMGNISKMDKSNPEAYIESIMSEIETNNSDILKQVQSGIKKRLKEEKVGDTIEAQLFKIHTGVETEGMYRMHRLGESNVGFGSGIASGSSEQSSSDYFKSRNPIKTKEGKDIKSIGNKPEEEYHTMMNEMVRFGIQKGMDVKHAGDKPIAGEMVNYLSKGKEGASDFWKKIQSDDSSSPYKDLKAFAGDSEKAVRMRAGELSTEDIRSEATSIVGARGGNTKKLESADRTELVNTLVEQLGFKGFLDELSALVQKDAIDGLAAQIKTWSPAKRGKPGFGLPPFKGESNDANFKSWATYAVSEQMKKGEINVRGDISEAQNPLYGMRTFVASPSSEYIKYKGKYGEMPVPEEKIQGIKSEGDRKQYSDKYRQSKATASNIQQELKAAAKGSATGAYSDMVKSSMEALYKQQEEIDEYNSRAKGDTYNAADNKKLSLVTRTIDRGATISPIANDTLRLGNGAMQKEVERLSNLAGIPGLSDTEQFDIQSENLSKFSDRKKLELKDSGKSKDDIESEANKYAEDMVEKAKAIKQLDRVVDVFESKRNEGHVLREMFPTEVNKNVPGISMDDARTGVFQEERSKVNARNLNIAESMANTPSGGSGAPGMGSGGVVPVHIVSADAGVTINVRGLEGAGYLPTGTSSGANRAPVSHLDSINKELNQFVEDNEKSAKTLKLLKPTRGAGQPQDKELYFSPSYLAGGGDTYGENKKSFSEDQRTIEQQNKLVENLTKYTKLEPTAQAHADWGTAIHAKISDKLKNEKNIKVEKYGSKTRPEFATLGGTADILEYADESKETVTKVADIKTVSDKDITKIKEAKVKAGNSTDINKIMEHVDDDLKRKLNDHYSQVNAYLKIFSNEPEGTELQSGEGAKGELKFYDKEGKGSDIKKFESVTFDYSKERFDSDMKQLSEARKRVRSSGTPFIKTYDHLPKNTENEYPGDEALDEVMDNAKAKIERGRNIRPSFNIDSSSSREKDVNQGSASEIAANEARYSKQEMFSNLSPDDIIDTYYQNKQSQGKVLNHYLLI